MRNQDNYGNRGDFYGQRRDRNQSTLGRGIDRLGQMGRNLMGGGRHEHDERNDQRNYADDFEGRNRYTEWQNRYSLGQNRQDMQPQYGRQDRSQYDYGDRERFSGTQGRFGSEGYDQDEDFNRYETGDRFNDESERYGSMGRGQSGFSPSYANEDHDSYFNSQDASGYETIPHAFSRQRFGVERSQQYRQPQSSQHTGQGSSSQAQFGQGLSSQYGQGQLQQWGRSTSMFDRESSASGARAQSMFAGRGPKGYQRSDDRVMEDVCEALTHHPQIDASDIEVKVNKGEVLLFGTVENRQAKRLAEDILENISGVREVKNELRVTNMMGSSMPENRQSQGQQNLGMNQSSSNQSTMGGSDFNLSPTTTNVGTSPTSQGTTGISGATSAASGRSSESRSLS